MPFPGTLSDPDRGPPVRRLGGFRIPGAGVAAPGHQLRHSSATHLGDANVSANVIMVKTGHKSVRSVQRYVKLGLAAVHQATATLSSPRRRE